MLPPRWKPPRSRRRAAQLPRTRHFGDRIGDRLLYGLTAAAAASVVLVVFAIVWRVADGAWPAIKVFHLNFLWDNVWNAPLNEFGARDLIIGTLVTSFGAILLAAPLSIAIGLFLSELAPPWIRARSERWSTCSPRCRAW